MKINKYKILSVKDRVADLLTRHPHLRDDDNKLIANIWNKDLLDIGLNPRKITAYHLLELKSKGKITSEKSIERSRRILQEKFNNLKGKKIEKRKDLEQQVRTEIKEEKWKK